MLRKSIGEFLLQPNLSLMDRRKIREMIALRGWGPHFFNNLPVDLPFREIYLPRIHETLQFHYAPTQIGPISSQFIHFNEFQFPPLDTLSTAFPISPNLINR